MAEEQDGEITFSSTNSSKEQQNGEQSLQSFNHWATREVPDPSIETHHWDPMNTNMRTDFL